MHIENAKFYLSIVSIPLLLCLLIQIQHVVFIDEMTIEHAVFRQALVLI